MKDKDLRKEIDELVGAGDAQTAAIRLTELWHLKGGSTAGLVVSSFKKLGEKLPLTKFRLAILRSFTVEPLVPLLRAAAFVAGIDLSIQVGDFNAYVQEFLTEDSQLYKFEPDAVILAVNTRDIVPELWGEFTDVKPGEVHEIESRVTEGFRDCITSFRKLSGASLGAVFLIDFVHFENTGN